jgi:hypothetical protein
MAWNRNKPAVLKSRDADQPFVRLADVFRA